MYYHIQILNYNDGTATKKSLYEFDNEKSAIAQFYKYVGSAMETDNVASALEIVFTNTGAIIESKYYVKPIEAEEEPTTDGE